MEDNKVPLSGHLEELRKRIIYSLIAIGIGFGASYGFSEQIYSLIALPIKPFLKDGNAFIFTGLTEAFFTYFKLSIFSGLILSSPVIIYQIWCFIAPGLYKKEKSYALPFVLLSTFFFLGGVSFCYFCVFPIACKFFAEFASDYIQMKLSIKDYLSFTCKFLLAFGIIFELPVFVLFLAKLGIVNDTQLRSNRKIVILVVFVIAAFLTPPDMVSQVLMAIPLIFLYELSIIIAKIFGKKKEVEEEDKEENEKEA